MLMRKLVSVIIPTYKRSDYLLQTIDSVLKQTYSPIEIIIVDDNGIGSEWQKATQAKLQKLIDDKTIVYIPHLKNKNGSAARNTGFKASRGEFINFLDDDDELSPSKIECQVITLLEKGDDYQATYCNRKSVRIQNITHKKIESFSHCSQQGDVLEDFLFSRCLISTSSILFRRNVIEKLQGWDESYFRHQDLELMTRFFEYFKICPTGDEPLMVYDLSKDRGNFPNPKRDFEIKKKYLHQFEPLFEKRGIKNAVMHYFWYNCMTNAIVSRNFTIAKKANHEMKHFGNCTWAEKKLLLKKIIIGLLNG